MKPFWINSLLRALPSLLLSAQATLASAQDAAPADRNAINTRARPGDMMADSPVTFPREGALPAKYPPNVKDHAEPSEKGGARLTVEPGRMACVEFEPRSGVFVGYTPLPDATAWRFEAPGSIVIEPDGKVGMLRVTLWTKENRVAIDHADRPGDSTAAMPCRLRITGLSQPAISLNGRAVTLTAAGTVELK